MELRHLRYFVAAAEAENVSRAALKLHVSQPALSRQIRDLEDELRFALFDRGAKSVKLTDAGRAFLDEARAVLRRADEAVALGRAVAGGHHGEIHLGYAPSPTVRILPATLRIFQAREPKVRVKLHDLSSEEMLSGLREGELRLAFMVRPARTALRGLQFEALVQDTMCLALPPGHPRAQATSIQRREASQMPLVVFNRKDYPEYTEMLQTLFASEKRKLRISEEHDSHTSLIAAIESGAGVAIVPRSFSCTAGPRLRLVPLAPAPAPLIIGAAWSQDLLNPAAETFLRCAREAAAALREDSASQHLPA